MKIAFSTLGCKINQYDSALMQESLREGFQVVSFDDIADVYVINTCTVTAKSDYQSRQLVRRAINKNEKAKIIVAGCYPQSNPDVFMSIKGVDLILGNQEKLELKKYLQIIEKESAPKIYVDKLNSDETFVHSDIKTFPNRTRAVLKVHDGCSSYCAFCIVPYVRGKARSARPEWVIAQIINFVDSGYKEVVLSGVNLGSYGIDMTPQMSLSSLVKEILEETEIQRIRISSVEPEDVTDELIDLVASEHRICKHLHLPLQSGDDTILSKMKRKYDSAYFKNLVLKIKDRIPDIGLGTDIIAGLPGEDEMAFENSAKMVEKLPFTYLHVFTYSKRRGTEAFSFNEQVSEQVKKERSRKLIEIGKKKTTAFKEGYINKVLDTLIEGEKDKKTGMLKGITGNYLRVLIKDEGIDLKNRIIFIRVVKIDNAGQLIGEIKEN